MDFYKGSNKCIIGEAGGVVGSTPFKVYGLLYFIKCKNDT